MLHECNQHPEQLRRAPGQRVRECRDSIARRYGVVHLEGESAKRAVSLGYPGIVDTRWKSERSSSDWIEWQCGLSEADLAEDCRRSFERARVSKQNGCTLDGQHANERNRGKQRRLHRLDAIPCESSLQRARLELSSFQLSVFRGQCQCQFPAFRLLGLSTRIAGSWYGHGQRATDS